MSASDRQVAQLTDAIQRISDAERRVTRRLVLLAAQDRLALAFAGVAAGASSGLLLARVAPGIESMLSRAPGPRTLTLLFLIGAAASAGILRLIHSRSGRCRSAVHVREDQGSFEIDRALGLEDRIASSRAVIDRGQPLNDVQGALLEDAAERIADVQPKLVIRYRPPRLSSAIRCVEANGLAIILGFFSLVVASQFGPRASSAAAADAGEIAAIEAAGNRLEEASDRIERNIDPATETARLAGEQRDIGRSLKEMAADPVKRRDLARLQSEALKKLNVLEYRIRERHQTLKQTRADEIVSLAEQRLRPALRSRSETNLAKPEGSTNKDQNQSPADTKPSAALDASSQANKTQPERPRDAEKPRTTSDGETAGGANKDERAAKSNEKDGEKSEAVSGSKRGPNNSPRLPKGSESAAAEQSLEGDPSGQSNTLKNELIGKAADLAAENAGKLAPALSDQLLKKASELRADQLSKADVEKLRQSAEALAKDLARIAQSDQMRKTVEELAAKVTPEQIEQLAQALKGQEQLLNELKATAEMMMENRQTRDMITGLARTIQKEFEGEERKNGGGSGSGETGDGKQSNPWAASDQKDQKTRAKPSSKSAQSKDSLARNRNREGELLYTNAKPGAAPSRTPYAAVYPRYRREAEQSVERSQVPANMRSLVSDYFDSINPDANKKH